MSKKAGARKTTPARGRSGKAVPSTGVPGGGKRSGRKSRAATASAGSEDPRAPSGDAVSAPDISASPHPAPPKQTRRVGLAAEARANPFRFFTSEEMGIMFDFGENVMTTLRGMGAPVVGRKMNPMLLLEWLKENHDRVPKVRADLGEGNDE